MGVGWPKWTIGDIRRVQDERVRRFLPEVYSYSPFYRQLWNDAGVDVSRIRSIEDLRKLPFTSKKDIVPTEENPARYRDIILQPKPEEIKKNLSTGQKLKLLSGSIFLGKNPKLAIIDKYNPIHITSTTGRSARAVPFLFTGADITILREAGARLLELAALDSLADSGINAFPFAPHLAFWQVAFAGFEARIRMLHTGGGRVMGSAAILDSLERLKATFFVGTPGYVYHILHMAAEQKRDLSSLRLCILGAEKANQPFKQKLKSLIAECGSENAKVLSTYGLTEAKHAWLECADAPDSRYHLYPDLELFEVVDPESGEPVPDGERGELVLTKLAGAGSVVVRYRTGDIVDGGIVVAECPHCGKVAPLMDTKIGRVSDVKKVKGVLLDFNEMFGWFAARGDIVEWQLEIGKVNDDPFQVDELRLKVALKEGVDKLRFEHQISEAARKEFEMKFDKFFYYTHEDLAEILGMDRLAKEARIVDKRS